MNVSVPDLSTICGMYNLPCPPEEKEWPLEEAYAFCKRLTYAHYENFPVGSLLVPKRLRPHVHAIYAFARVSDDFSDEKEYEGTRMEFLEGWDWALEDCYRGEAHNPIFIALGNTVKECDLPIELLRGLLIAFKRDVLVSRYETWESVLADYCQFSANPVGRLILYLFDYRDEERLLLSDHICTALQLANFWQDVAVDLKKDRIYIPREEMAAEGYSEEELFAHVYDERYRRVMAKMVSRTWDLFNQGYPLVERVGFPLSVELRLTWLGGTTILQRTKLCDYNVFAHRPKLHKSDFLRLGLRSFVNISSARKKIDEFFSKG